MHRRQGRRDRKDTRSSADISNSPSPEIDLQNVKNCETHSINPLPLYEIYDNDVIRLKLH